MATITQNNIDLNPITRASLSPVHTVSDTSSSASPSPFPSTSIAVLRSIRSAEPVPSTHSKRFLVRKKSSKVLHNTTDTLHEFQRRKLSLKPQPPPRKGRRPSFGRVPSKPPPSYRRKFVSKSPMPPPPRRKGTSGTQSVDSLPSPRDLPRYVFLRMDSHKVAMYRVSTFWLIFRFIGFLIFYCFCPLIRRAVPFSFVFGCLLTQWFTDYIFTMSLSLPFTAFTVYKSQRGHSPKRTTSTTTDHLFQVDYTQNPQEITITEIPTFLPFTCQWDEW